MIMITKQGSGIEGDPGIDVRKRCGQNEFQQTVSIFSLAYSTLQDY